MSNTETSKIDWVRWEKVLVCRHPHVEKVYHMGVTQPDFGAVKEFYRIHWKGSGFFDDFDSIDAANDRLNQITEAYRAQGVEIK
jgi:hypothetical protein